MLCLGLRQIRRHPPVLLLQLLVFENELPVQLLLFCRHLCKRLNPVSHLLDLFADHAPVLGVGEGQFSRTLYPEGEVLWLLLDWLCYLGSRRRTQLLDQGRLERAGRS